MCIYLLNSNKKGISLTNTLFFSLIREPSVSSLSLSRKVGINKTTAWFVLQRFRFVGKNFCLQTEFSGITEAFCLNKHYEHGKSFFQSIIEYQKACLTLLVDIGRILPLIHNGFCAIEENGEINQEQKIVQTALIARAVILHVRYEQFVSLASGEYEKDGTKTRKTESGSYDEFFKYNPNLEKAFQHPNLKPYKDLVEHGIAFHQSADKSMNNSLIKVIQDGETKDFKKYKNFNYKITAIRQALCHNKYNVGVHGNETVDEFVWRDVGFLDP